MSHLESSDITQSHAYPSPSPHRNGQPAQSPAATAAAALSQQSFPPNPSISDSSKKRKVTIPGSRGVANLTPEQLAKKRANDREAQRAIRERTRTTIDALERRIHELESQQPFQELQRVTQERDRALAKCEELRRRLEAVAGIVGSQHPKLAALTAQQSPLPSAANGQPTASPALGSVPEPQQQHIHPDLRQSYASPQPMSSSPNRFGAPVDPGDRRGRPQPYPPVNGIREGTKRPSITAPMPQHSNGERLGLDFLLDPSHQHVPTPVSSTSPFPSPHDCDQPPLYARLTNVGPSSCPLDSLLLNFHANRRNILREGGSPAEAIGPEYPSMAALADSTVPLTISHPVSVFLIEVLSKFPDISEVPEKIAVFYIMFLIMRWLVCPCFTCYERLPEWCRPVSEQLDKSHPAWIDYLPWPSMRRRLCDSPVEFANFFVPFTTTLSLNWPLPSDCVLLPARATAADDLPAASINPAFEHHIRKLENWSLGPRFQIMLPHLVDETVTIK